VHLERSATEALMELVLRWEEWLHLNEWYLQQLSDFLGQLAHGNPEAWITVLIGVIVFGFYLVDDCWMNRKRIRSVPKATRPPETKLG
jgi:hypothetical protein